MHAGAGYVVCEGLCLYRLLMCWYEIRFGAHVDDDSLRAEHSCKLKCDNPSR